MKSSFRQSMAWLHTWAGLVTGWVLFFVFVTGTAGYVNDEITRWMQPERPLVARTVPQPDSAVLDTALNRLQSVAPQAKSWTITLPHQGDRPRAMRELAIAWEDLPAQGQNFGRRSNETLNLLTGQPQQDIEPRATAGGNGLYRMHYALRYMPYSTAIKVVGICTMLMLLAVITGVITHKKIFTDFFTFRPGKGQRSWLDGHNIVSVMSLPFFLMITYTGLIFFLFTYLPAGRDVIYGDTAAGRQAYTEAIRTPRLEHLPVSAPALPLSVFLQQARDVWGPDQVATLIVTHPKDKPAYVELRRVGVGGIQWNRPETLRYLAQDGTLLDEQDERNATVQTQQILLALHEGRFADWGLRWLYVVSGLLGCAVIGTGLVLWTVKRRTKHQQAQAKNKTDSFTARLDAAGLHLVEILNVGTLVGLPLGVAAYFWANRLLPLTMAERANWEINTLFFVWGWALLFSIWRPLKRAWLELLWLSVAAFALIPVVNALTTDKHLGITLPLGDWGLAGFDLSMLGLAALFAYTAVKLQRKWQLLPSAPKRTPAPSNKTVQVAP